MDASGDFKDDAGPPTGLNGTEDETERTTESARPAEIESNARRPAESDITKVPSRELDGMNKVESKGGLSVDSAEDPLAEFTFPDGGVLAWTSVFCQFAVHFFVLGISTSVGLFTDYFVSNAVFPGAANTLLSFASTLTTTGIDLYGPLTGLLAEKFSYRLVACTGAILVCSGGLINSFAVSAWTLFVGGLVTGLGYSCMLAPALAIPTHYFRRRLSLAFGLGMSGSGIGGAVIIPTTAALISSLSWRWAYRIIAIVSGVICFVAGLLMRTRLPKRKSHPLLDTAMFRNKTYWKLALSVFFFAPVFLCPFLYIPQQIQDLGGEGGAISGALCLALLNVFTAIGQVAAGLAMKRVGQYNLMVITNVANLLLFCPLYLLTASRSTSGLLVFSILAGLFAAPFPVLIADVAADCFGQDGFATKVSMCYWWFAPGMFITGPILGSIADRFSLFTPEGARISTDWTWLILYCTFCQAVVVLLGGWLRVQRGGWKLALV